jgi:hypothetical protein
MESVTLLSLRTQARELSDMVNSTFVSDSEFNNYLDQSYAELYDILVSRFEDYYTKAPLQFTIPSGSNTFTLPSDFYKMRGLDLSSSGNVGIDDWITVRPFNFQERNRRNTIVRRNLVGQLNISYRMIGNTIYVLPEDQANALYRLWYVPTRTKLVLDTDTMDSVDGWHMYIVVDAAIKALNKEESDVSVLMAQKQALLVRIQAMASNRDAGEPERIADVSQNLFDINLPYLR